MVALLSWAAAALQAPLRDSWVGWDEMTKRRRLHEFIPCFCILVDPWAVGVAWLEQLRQDEGG